MPSFNIALLAFGFMQAGCVGVPAFHFSEEETNG